MATDWYAVTMAEFAGGMIAGRNVDRPVIDETGLTGRYDIHLEYVPYRAEGPAIPAAGDAEAGPSILTALQEQLGLRLSPAKRPLDVIVVDHAEKPSPN